MKSNKKLFLIYLLFPILAIVLFSIGTVIHLIIFDTYGNESMVSDFFMAIGYIGLLSIIISFFRLIKDERKKSIVDLIIFIVTGLSAFGWFVFIFVSRLVVSLPPFIVFTYISITAYRSMRQSNLILIKSLNFKGAEILKTISNLEFIKSIPARMKEDKKFRKKGIIIGSVILILLLIGISSPISNSSRQSSNSTGSSSSSVPYNVKVEVMMTLGIDSSRGGEIIKLTGKKEQTFVDGSELWAVSVKFKLCSECSTTSINTKIQVE